MVALNSELIQSSRASFQQYNQVDFVAKSAGLLTLPQLHANSLRLELLVHLSILLCTGTKKTTRKQLDSILNKEFDGRIVIQEDPAEDVFCSNVAGPDGDMLVFNGLWEGNDYYVQCLIDILFKKNIPAELHSARASILAILKISEEVARRSGVKRNLYAHSKDKARIRLPQSRELDTISSRVTFSDSEVSAIGVNPKSISPFLFNEPAKVLLGQELGNSDLERRPIVKKSGKYIVALPNSIGLAIRSYFLQECERHGLLKQFSSILIGVQFRSLHKLLSITLRSELEKLEIEQETPDIDDLPPLASILMRLSHSKYLHVVMFEENLEELLIEGFSSFHTWNDRQQNAIEQFINHTSILCSDQEGYKYGLTLVVYGGLGRGQILTSRKQAPNWHFSGISIADFSLIARSSAGIKDLLLCLEQENWLLTSKVDLFNVNGPVNFYGFWKESEYLCLPNEISPAEGGVLSLYTDYVLPVRRHIRTTLDQHSAVDTFGEQNTVLKTSQDSFFESRNNLPLYVSVDQLEKGLLNALIELDDLHIWFSFVSNGAIPRELLYEWWSGFSGLLAEALMSAFKGNDFRETLSFQVKVDFSFVAIRSESNNEHSEEIGIESSRKRSLIHIILGRDFLSHFRTEENVGERLILLELASQIECAIASEGIRTDTDLSQSITDMLDDTGVRIIHLYQSFDESEYLLARKAEQAVLCDNKRINFYKLQLVQISKLSEKELRDPAQCCSELNSLVRAAFKQISDELSVLNKLQTIEELTDRLNNIYRDGDHWHRTAKAMVAIHGTSDDVFAISQNRESERALTTICIRSLIEVSLSECADNDGFSPSQLQIEELIARCATLVSIARDSDLIHWGLVDGYLKIHPSGNYEIEADLANRILIPYLSSHYETQFKQSIESYDSMYQDKKNEGSQPASKVFGIEFSKAFESEVGLPLDLCVEIFSCLADLLVQREKTHDCFSMDEITKQFSGNTPVALKELKMFLSYFCQSPRENGFATIPTGCSMRDIQIWKHKRKLSCLVKPLLALENHGIFISLLLLRQSFNYFFTKAHAGEFPPGFFESDEMKRYRGKAVKRKGEAFEKEVGKIFEGKGWVVKSNIFMSSLGADEKLGEIDLVAEKEGRYYLIECKCLQVAKTVSEIADVCDDFRGEAGDDLNKHLKRVKWIGENKKNLLNFLNKQEPLRYLDHLIVTQAQMPFRFLSSLPIEPSKIVTAQEIDSGKLRLD